MSDRLQELLRQRAAIQTHLAWLDREIIALSRPIAPGSSGTTASPQTQAAANSADISTSPTSTTNIPDPDVILASYQQNTQNLRTDLRNGCLVYFFGAFFLLGLAVVSFYFVNRLIRQHSTPAPSEQRTTPAGER